MEGGILLNCQKGTLKINAKNIEINSNTNITFRASDKITHNADHVHFYVRDLDVDPGRFNGNVKKGDIMVRELGFLFSCFSGSEVKEWGT